jgi:hypothetical protein
MNREQVAEIFYNPAHPMNEVLKQEFGYVDESLGGLVVYNPSMEEMNNQLMILTAKEWYESNRNPEI